MKEAELDRQIKWDLRFLSLARHISLWSKDPSTKTGAVLVKPINEIISVGYNGFPRRFHDEMSSYENRGIKYSKIIHAEMNALQRAKHDLENCTLYTWPFMPCDRCFVHVVNVGVIRCVYPKATDDQLLRWGDSFKKTLKYAQDANIKMVEYDLTSLVL